MQSPQPAELAILLVDDERQTLKYFERAFAKDFRVLTAASADEAEAIVDADPARIGLVISDQRMPGRTGVSLLNAVRRKHPRIVRMLTTAYSELDDAIEAVNRGEILRYIVKPWDFDLLRQEIKTGLLVYTLQNERDLLIGEKLNVRQRMLAVDRVRDLTIIAAGQPRLRYARLAIDDYVRDSVDSAVAVSGLTSGAGLDLWGLPQTEASHMGAVARAVAATTERLSDAAPGNASVSDCVRDAVAATAALASDGGVTVLKDVASGLPVGVAPSVLTGLIADALAAVIRATPAGGAVTLSASNGATVNGTTGVALKIVSAGSAPWPDPILYGSASPKENDEPGRLFAAYVAARESGGTIQVGRSESAVQAEIALPADRQKANVVDVRPDWLTGLFARFENWPV